MTLKRRSSTDSDPPFRRRANTFPCDDEKLESQGTGDKWSIVRHGAWDVVPTLQSPISDVDRALVHLPRSPDGTSEPSSSQSAGSAALIPHTPWNVILHKAATGRAVLYNRDEKKIVVQRATASVSHVVTDKLCLLCRQPWSKRRRTAQQDDSEEETELCDSFINQDYFRLLESITPDVGDSDGQGHLPPPSSPTKSSSAHDPKPLPIPSISISEPTQSAEPTGLSEGSFNQGYYDRFFVEERKLGRGLRGSVFLCQHVPVLDQVPLGQFAVKAIPVGTSHAWLVRMLKEVHLLERLRHPNIIEYKHAWLEHRQLTQFGPEVPCLFVLMELANGGNLEEYIYVQWHPDSTDRIVNSGQLSSDDDRDFNHLTPKERVKRLRERKRRRQEQSRLPPSISSLASASVHKSTRSNRAQMHGGIGRGPQGKKVRFLKDYEIWCLFLDICKGLAHLHKHGIIHRDLKPPNLLLHFADPSDKDEIPRILISDFGECEVLSDETQRERTGATGTLEFMPPELLVKDSSGHYLNDHSPKADMWSLGVVLYFLCYSSVPYSQTDDVDALREEIVGFDSVTFPDHGTRVPTELQSLVTKLLSRNARDRPSVEEILSTYGHLNTSNRSSPLTPNTTLESTRTETFRTDDGLKRIVKKLTFEELKVQGAGDGVPRRYSEPEVRSARWDTTPVRPVPSLPSTTNSESWAEKRRVGVFATTVVTLLASPPSPPGMVYAAMFFACCEVGL
ncbi:hypothetical protein SpCBS45565_g04125 [Spizellomyces sp. 'palustris']|nr:hypothetical protein SpCBS45565_g04125 [Spizellomyces sp. 'palustris']